MNILLFIIWFYLPAGLANSVPVIAAKLPFLKKFDCPMDFGMELGGKRVFGAHKTIRGLVAGVIVAIGVAYLQQYIYSESSWLQQRSIVDYSTLSPVLLGVLMGAGAIIGDAIKSFFKRRVGVKPGGMWFPFDQIDFIIGSSIFSYMYIQLPWYYYIGALVVWLVIHLLTNLTAYLLKLKDVPY